MRTKIVTAVSGARGAPETERIKADMLRKNLRCQKHRAETEHGHQMEEIALMGKKKR